jgi:hypothetical protein
MRGKKDNLADRLGDAAKARQALIARTRAMSPAADPDFAEKQAARVAAGLARDLRESERRAAKAAEAALIAADRKAADDAKAASRAAAEVAERERQEAAAQEIQREQASREGAREQDAASVLAQAAEAKATRDARYAARKSRVKSGTK